MANKVKKSKKEVPVFDYVFDIETDKFEMQNKKLIEFKYCCVLKYKREDFSIDSHKMFFLQSDFGNYLVSLCAKPNEKAPKCFAHNMEFDISYAYKYFIDAGYIVKPIIAGGKNIYTRICAKTHHKNKKGQIVEGLRTVLEFRDSYSLFKEPLKNVGKFAGIEKLDNDKEFADIRKEDLEYCYRDCEIVVMALKKFMELFTRLANTTDIPITIASAAFRVFKEQNIDFYPVVDPETGLTEMKKICPWFNENEVQNQIFRKFYRGGRVEAFLFEIMKNGCYYDINSLYPYIMVKYRFPKPRYESREGFEEGPLVFAYLCNIDESNESIPLIPEIDDGFMVYKAGKKEALLFIEEYEYLKSRNIPINVKQTWICSEWGNPFEYLMEFYNLKKEDGPFRYCYKILMNSTYGRFGIDSNKENLQIMPMAESNYEDGCYIPDMDIDFEEKTIPYLIGHKDENIHFDKNLIIACRVTALARLYITQSMHELQAKGVKIWYCDTDSIVAESSAAQFLDMESPDDREIGKFKSEHDFLEFQALSSKEYFAILQNENLTKGKGINAQGIADLIKYHSEEGLSCHSVSKTKTQIKSGNISTPWNRVTIKHAQNVYFKRIINPDLTTSPICGPLDKEVNRKIWPKILSNLQNMEKRSHPETKKKKVV